MEENHTPQKDDDQNRNGKKPPNRSFLLMLVISVGLTLLFFYVYSKYQAGQREEIPYGQFLDMLKEGTVEKVKIYNSTIEIIPKGQSTVNNKRSYCRDKIPLEC